MKVSVKDILEFQEGAEKTSKELESLSYAIQQDAELYDKLKVLFSSPTGPAARLQYISRLLHSGSSYAKSLIDSVVIDWPPDNYK